MTCVPPRMLPVGYSRHNVMLYIGHYVAPLVTLQREFELGQAFLARTGQKHHERENRGKRESIRRQDNIILGQKFAVDDWL